LFLRKRMEKSLLTKLRYSHVDKWGAAHYFYKCECGAVCVKREYQVKSLNTRSCGHLQRQAQRENLKKRVNFKKGHTLWKNRKDWTPWNKGLKNSPNKGKIYVIPDGVSRVKEDPSKTGPVKGGTYIKPERQDAEYCGVSEECLRSIQHSDQWGQRIKPFDEDYHARIKRKKDVKITA